MPKDPSSEKITVMMTTHATMVKTVHLMELNLEKKVTGAPLSRSSLVSSNPKKPSPSQSIKLYSYSFTYIDSSGVCSEIEDLVDTGCTDFDGAILFNLVGNYAISEAPF